MFAICVACAAREPAPVAPPAPLVMPRQIKGDRDFVVRWQPVAYAIVDGNIAMDGRTITVTGTGPIEAIAHQLARVPKPLRDLIQTIKISAVASDDTVFRKKYKMNVVAGMSANADGDVTIYPYGLQHLSDPDFFTRNLMHELGHTWSSAAWRHDGDALKAWVDAIGKDTAAPSEYADTSFKNSGLPFEDAAEATALYFLVQGTPLFDRYRAVMPARFALIAARFPN
jgi:hypothetical protein